MDCRVYLFRLNTPFLICYPTKLMHQRVQMHFQLDEVQRFERNGPCTRGSKSTWICNILKMLNRNPSKQSAKQFTVHIALKQSQQKLHGFTRLSVHTQNASSDHSQNLSSFPSPNKFNLSSFHFIESASTKRTVRRNAIDPELVWYGTICANFTIFVPLAPSIGPIGSNASF